ncbi:Plastocyanin-like protein [Corchorus olitorius]|uniref:Plastocyanin-like protein n=1 Tax=Corchorus olitorius TaxID=93759 RepID=A0A1R3GI97_9ROSI|nr:Plastocyanin-like protein [Corchorus olitorius]
MAKTSKLAILAIALCAIFQATAAQTTHVVGDELGWLVPPGGPLAYATWAAMQTFTVGDVLIFNFTTGDQDVARVTKEAYETCNSTNPITLITTGPANFTLDSIGEYFFIGTMDRRCTLGQKLAINVSAPGPKPSPVPPPPRGPITYTIGDDLGWLVPPGGAIAYATWAFDKIFLIGDTLVFEFINGTQDVAVVTKEAYEKCNTTNPITILTTSPANITLTTKGEHFFTSTYGGHCELGQKLAINVTASSSGTANPPSTSTSPVSEGPSGSALPPVSSAPYRVGAGFLVTLFSIAIVFF